MVLTLSMTAKNFPPVKSYNLIAEITGSDFPDQVVMLGGHSDSWDVGQGAEDDAAGKRLLRVLNFNFQKQRFHGILGSRVSDQESRNPSSKNTSLDCLGL